MRTHDLQWPDGRRVQTGMCFGVDWFWRLESHDEDDEPIGGEGFLTEAAALADAARACEVGDGAQAPDRQRI
jgi:hypothetical protein